MLLMFAVGMGSLAWMFALGAVMAIEKNASWGRGLSRPLGIVLIAAGSALVLAAFAG
jgi:predicted metal-binding membrane protein